ncbi:hypothetical protein M569_08923 [Genlisea aurea]|uniref:Uncharacterized protein n=1 Tax=Genlisea aurea TaxID=192259 RepID=S8CG33_9LAMI|nr:hypothetical protein M569_08923 [Genlisea aurea]
MSRLLLSTAAHRHGCPPEALPISTAAAATFTGGFLPWWSKSGVAVTLRCNALSRSQSDKPPFLSPISNSLL